jgi:hypothetical protein
MGRAWRSWPVRTVRWTAIAGGFVSLYGSRASRRLIHAAGAHTVRSRPVLFARRRTRWAVAIAGGWLRGSLRRAVAWARAVRGNPLVGWLRRLVARALLLWGLVDLLARLRARRHPQPPAPQPPAPMNPPKRPAPPAAAPPPPVSSPRFPNPRRDTPVTVLPMHQAVAELIDSAEQMGQTQFDNWADCRLFVASLPALMDHGGAAMLLAREFVMDHAATAATFEQAWGDFVAQFQALSSANDAVMAQLEAWTGRAELPPVLHPAVMGVCEAWDALGAVQHANLEEARMLCGSLHTVFRYLAQAVANASTNIAFHSPTAAGFAAEADQYQLALASMEDEALQAMQHLEVWVEEPEVTA